MWTSFLSPNSARNWNFVTCSGHLCPSTSSGSPGEFRWVSPGSCISCVGWWSWVLFDTGGDYLSHPSWKILGRTVGIYQGIPTQCLDAEWGLFDRYQGMPTQLKDTGRIWLKDVKGIPTQWKGMGGGGAQLKDTEEYPGLIWKLSRFFSFSRLSGLCWVVR